MDTVGKNLTKSITLKLPLETINETLVENIASLCESKKGPHLLKLKVVDEHDLIGIDLISTSCKVEVDYRFIAELEELGIGYKLN